MNWRVHSSSRGWDDSGLPFPGISASAACEVSAGDTEGGSSSWLLSSTKPALASAPSAAHTSLAQGQGTGETVASRRAVVCDAGVAASELDRAPDTVLATAASSAASRMPVEAGVGHHDALLLAAEGALKAVSGAAGDARGSYRSGATEGRATVGEACQVPSVAVVSSWTQATWSDGLAKGLAEPAGNAIGA